MSIGGMTAGCGYSVGINFGKEYYNMIVNAGYRGKVGAKATKFTYTGQYNIRKDGVVELLTSGTIVFLEPKVIDLFMVGGGGAGSTFSTSDQTGLAGGGGGYTRTLRRINIASNESVTVTIGAGAVFNISQQRAPEGGTTAFGSYTVKGGSASGWLNGDGKTGGSGGGGGTTSSSDGGAGGYNGGNGERGGNNGHIGGAGQGFTTREFGEPSGKLYAGGGGGGRYMASSSPVVSVGGAGGGGSGGWVGSSAKQEPAAGVANTGGGGGGGAVSYSIATGAGSGGSGIVCFREAQELPELAGTWVLNNRLYAPENNIIQELSYTLKGNNYNGIAIDNRAVKVRLVGNSGYSVLYTFSANSWSGYATPISIAITSTTASDEFRAWLASNATKQ